MVSNRCLSIYCEGSQPYAKIIKQVWAVSEIYGWGANGIHPMGFFTEFPWEHVSKGYR